MTPPNGARIGGVGDRLRRLGRARAGGLLARGLGLAARGLLVVLLLGDGPLGEEALVALAVGPHVLQLLGGAGHVRLGLGAREGGGARVELGEERPLRDVVAALDERLDDAPGRVGGEVGALVRREHPGQAEELRDRLLGDERRLDVDLVRRRRAWPRRWRPTRASNRRPEGRARAAECKRRRRVPGIA